MEDISFYFLLLLLKALNDYRLSLHECYRDACLRTMNFEVTVTFTHIILTAVTRKLSRYRNLKPYLYYPFYNILCERFLSIRQRYKAFLAESMFVIEQALSQDYLANYWCFFVFLFFRFKFDLHDLEWQY